MNTEEQEYFYIVKMVDVEDGFGNPLLPEEIVMAFYSKPSMAHSQFFNMGYNMDHDNRLFIDNGIQNMTETFETTDGSDPYEDDIPDRLRILVKHHPLLRVYKDAKFDRLTVQRNLVNFPNFQGGKRVQRSKRSKRSRRFRRSRRT